jgi:hypothetical protein
MEESDPKKDAAYLRHSRSALPIQLGCGVLLCGALWMSWWLWGRPAQWVCWSITAVGAFAVTGDVVNILILSRRTRTQQDKENERTAPKENP